MHPQPTLRLVTVLTLLWSGQGYAQSLEDGLPPEDFLSSEQTFFLFGRSGSWFPGWSSDHGHLYQDSRGYGWSRQVQGGTTGEFKEVPFGNTFLSADDPSEWKCQVENGVYRITICLGSKTEALRDQNVWIQGKPLVAMANLAKGQFLEKSLTITIEDRWLRVVIGRKGASAATQINWAIVEMLGEKPQKQGS